MSLGKLDEEASVRVRYGSFSRRVNNGAVRSYHSFTEGLEPLRITQSREAKHHPLPVDASYPHHYGTADGMSTRQFNSRHDVL